MDPNSSSSSSLQAAFEKYLSDPLNFPQKFTQWIYAIVGNPTFQPQRQGIAAIAAPLSQSFADSGHTDFFTQGVWIVEVALGSSLIGGALVFCGLDTGGTNKTVVILGSGVASDGVTVVFSVQNNTSATAVFRTLTAGASGGNVIVTYRRSTVTS